jgi:hypothetical protein
MKKKEPHQINEFKVMDEHGNDYTLIEYQNLPKRGPLNGARPGQVGLGWPTELPSARSTMERSGLRQVTRSFADKRHNLGSTRSRLR